MVASESSQNRRNDIPSRLYAMLIRELDLSERWRNCFVRANRAKGGYASVGDVLEKSESNL